MWFRPSSGLFRAARHLRYAGAHIDPETRERTYSLVSVESTPYLEATLERAARSPGGTPGELASALVNDSSGDAGGEVSLDEAREYIDQLIDAQILVSESSAHHDGARANR